MERARVHACHTGCLSHKADGKRHLQPAPRRAAPSTTACRARTQVYCVDLSQDSELVLSCCDSGEARLWTVSTGEPCSSFVCGAPIHGGEISADKLLVATGDQGGFGRVWDTAEGQETCVVDCGKAIRAVDLSGARAMRGAHTRLDEMEMTRRDGAQMIGRERDSDRRPGYYKVMSRNE